MEKTYKTTVLFRTNDASNEFASYSYALKPGQPFSPPQNKSILISGGFPRLSPETPFPLSPTLQLNSDLTNWGPGSLEILSKSELKRVNAISYRSFTVEVDNRVAVFASRAKQLEIFMETYEGVLELEPFLLQGSHPEYPTIAEYEISESKPFCISYTVKSPINSEKCTYCGECGTICPENCLSELLFLDYGKCSFCKECEKICPTGAVDIYGVEERRLEIPSIVILEGTGLEIAENHGAVYQEGQLASLFKSLYPYQVEEVISCDGRKCQYNGNLNIGCSLCCNSCNYDAVRKSGSGIEIDSHRCQECGNCIAVCPSGAIQYERFNDRSFTDYFGSVLLPDGWSVVVGEEEELHKLWWKHKGQRYKHQFFFEYPKVEALSLFHLLFLFARGAGRVVLLSKKSEPGGFNDQVKMANRIIQSLFSIEDFFILTSSPISSHLLQQMQQDTHLEKVYEVSGFQGRRTKLASLLEFLVKASKAVVSLRAGEMQGFGNIICDTERCTQCLACLNECSINALSSDEKELSLNYRAGNCVACGICVQICPESALSFASEFTLDSAFFQERRLAKADPAVCKKCGKIFGTRKSLEKVMQLLSNHPLSGDNYLEFCEDCKVERMFQTEEI